MVVKNARNIVSGVPVLQDVIIIKNKNHTINAIQSQVVENNLTKRNLSLSTHIFTLKYKLNEVIDYAEVI